MDALFVRVAELKRRAILGLVLTISSTAFTHHSLWYDY